ncbi:MAG TPA: tetratricopeptide repeat protein, partial [Pyrinomonadaceae bacterium]|nr:tetratricopeptide repeat protein [Pyrinomonadaceae bacterium]
MSKVSKPETEYLEVQTSLRLLLRRVLLVLMVPILAAQVSVTSIPIVRGIIANAATDYSSSQDVNSLLLGKPIEKELKGGETHSYEIRMAAGQFLHVVVDQRGIDVVVTLLGPEGKSLIRVDSPNSNRGPEPLLAIAETAGKYRIDVNAPNQNTPVALYEIRLNALRDATSNDHNHLTADRVFWEGNRLRLQRSAGSAREAIEQYKQAIAFFKTSGDSYRQALTLMVIGSIHAGFGEFQASLEYNEQSLRLFRTLGDKERQSGVLNNIGGAHNVLGNKRKALECFAEALAVLPKGSPTVVEGATLSNLGLIHNDLSNWQKALEYYLQALPMFEALDEKRRQAITLNNIGVAFFNLGETERSLAYYRRALSLRRGIGDKQGEASTLTSIGQVHTLSGEATQALGFFRQALPLRKEAGDRLGEATTLDYIGIAHSSLGEKEKALEFHQQALELRKLVGDLRGEALTLSNLGYTYSLLDQSLQAIENYNQAITLLRRLGDRQHEANALYRLARTERKQGKLEEALQHVEASLSLFEDVRANVSADRLRASYLASKQDAYEFCTGLLMEMHRLEPTKGYDALALQTTERARARTLTELLAEARVDIRQGVDTKLIEREQDLIQQLNTKAQRQIQLMAQNSSQEPLTQLNKEINALEDEYEQVRTAIRKSSPQYASLTQPEPLSIRQIQEQLDQDTVLLEYSLGTERSYVWLVTQNTLKTYELPGRDQIQKTARQVYELLTARSLFKVGETAAQRRERIAQADSKLLDVAFELSQMVIRPVASELGNKRLVVVADGALQYVPFALLPIPRNTEAEQAYVPLVVK